MLDGLTTTQKSMLRRETIATHYAVDALMRRRDPCAPARILALTASLAAAISSAGYSDKQIGEVISTAIATLASDDFEATPTDLSFARTVSMNDTVLPPNTARYMERVDATAAGNL